MYIFPQTTSLLLTAPVRSHDQFYSSSAAASLARLSLNACSRLNQTTSANRDSESAAKFIGAGAATVEVAGSLIIGYARNPSMKQQLFSYAILGFALSEASVS